MAFSLLPKEQPGCMAQPKRDAQLVRFTEKLNEGDAQMASSGYRSRVA